MNSEYRICNHHDTSRDDSEQENILDRADLFLHDQAVSDHGKHG